MMDWLNPFQHVDKHPRTVAVVLMGVLVASAIGGSFYTRSLQNELRGFRSASDQQLATWQQRVQLERETRLQDSIRFAEELEVADAQIHALLTGVAGVDRSTRRLLVDLREIVPLFSTDSERIAGVQMNIDSIEFQLDSVRSAMVAARLMERLRVHHSIDMVPPARSVEAEGTLANYALLIALGIVSLIVVLGANFFLDQKRKREMQRDIRELQKRLRVFENTVH